MTAHRSPVDTPIGARPIHLAAVSGERMAPFRPPHSFECPVCFDQSGSPRAWVVVLTVLGGAIGLGSYAVIDTAVRVVWGWLP